MRAFYTSAIVRLLTEHGSVATGQIVEALGVNERTVVAYLRYLRDVKRTIRRSGYLKGATLWELGEDTTARKKTPPVEEMRQSQAFVPARQMGMRRDALVAALFGPAVREAAVQSPLFSKDPTNIQY
jgi:hypothetical protein